MQAGCFAGSVVQRAFVASRAMVYVTIIRTSVGGVEEFMLLSMSRELIGNIN